MALQNILLLFFVTFLFGICQCKTTKTHCQLPLVSTQFLYGKWPLVFSVDGDLYPVTVDEKGEETIAIADKAEVLLSCAPNYLKNIPTRTTHLKVTCDASTGNLLTDAGILKSIEHFQCDLRVIEEVVSQVHGCTKSNWVATKFGYVHPMEQVSYILGEACYDHELGKTVFAHVRLGAESFYLEKLAKDFLIKNQHPSGRYKVELMKKLRFDAIYERMQHELLLKYPIPLDLRHFLDAKMLHSRQYEGINKLVWNYLVTLESNKSLDFLKTFIKNLSESMDLDLYVGGHDVSVLHNNDKTLEMFMDADNKRFPMPKLVWMLIKHETKALGFIVHNNDEAAISSNAITSEKQFDDNNWLMFKEIVGKNIMCYSYEELRKIIPDVPELGNVESTFA